MDFGDIKSGCSTSSSFNVAFMSENRCCQDTQHRHRKLPHKRLRVARTSVLVIDQLKSGFQRAGDFATRMRTRRNWRPEFLIRYLCDNRRGDNEECAAVQRGKSCCRSFVPETPRIYSIGLQSGVKNIGHFDDYLSSCSALRNFKKRFHRLLISASKHWVAQSTASLSTAVSLRKHTNQQTRLINCLKSTDVFQLDRSEKSSRHDDQSYEPIEEKDDDDVPNTLQSNHTVGDRSFMPDLHHPLAEKDRKHDGPRVTKKDAQVQTSSRKTPRRKKTMRKSRPTNEGILSRENVSDNPTFTSSIADLRSDFHSSNGTNRNEDYDSRLSIKFLENKRAEYINKFTAVKRQIEEITATLKETCYSEKSSRGKPKNSDGYLSSAHDDANENSKQDVDPDEVGDEEDNRTKRKMILREEKNTSEEEDEIIGRSAGDPESVKNILDVSNINDGPQVFFDKKCSNNTIVSTTNLYRSPSADDVFVHDCIRAFTIKEMLHPSNGTPRICHKKRAKCRFVKQISFDLDFTKDNDEPWGFSGEDRSVYLRDHFAAANDDDDAEVLMEDSSNLEEPRKHKMIVDEKVGEIAILNDIKRRIDRDFDDPSINSENDTEDFLTFSQKTVNLENDSQLYQSAAANDTTSTMIVESPQSLDSSETQIRDSVWADTKSELSNRNSTFSIYHSCTQFSSLVSLRENEDELALEAEDRSEVDDDSHSNIDYYESNVHSNVDYSPVPGNGHTQSNLNFDRSHDDGQRIVQHNASKRKYTTSNKFLSGTIDESNEACDMFVDREMANQAYDCDHVDDESNEAERELHIHSEQQYTVDSTFETSKSSRYIGSIDSGVFVNSSLIDLQPHESSFDGSKLNHNKRKQRRMKERELHGSPRTFDFSSDSNSSSSSCCTDDTLDRRINDVIRDLTKKLVLYERKVRMKLMWKAGLRARDMRYYRHSPPRACKFNDSPFGAYDFFKSPRRPNEDERISGISTPSFMSLPDSEMEDHESTCYS